MGTGIREAGVLYVKRPGRLRWDYTEPESKTALVVGNKMSLYLPEDRQLLRGTIAEGSSALSDLLAARSQLHELFEETLVATPDVGGGGAYRIRLVPRSSTGEVEAVTITTRPPEFGIEAAEVLDGLGNRTQFHFKSQRRNRGVSERLFHFEPPPGTEIVDQP